MPDDPQPQSRLNTVLRILIAIVVVPAVPILILALAIAEYLFLGTEYIGKAMEATGTGPFFEWLQDLLHWQLPMPVW